MRVNFETALVILIICGIAGFSMVLVLRRYQGEKQDNKRYRLTFASRARVDIAAAVALVFAVLSIVVSYNVAPPASQPQMPSLPTVRDTSVSVAIQTVGATQDLFTTSGSYRNLPNDASLWLISTRSDSSQFYPSAEPCATVQSNFTCALSGQPGPTDRIKTIVLVAADATATDVLRKYSAESRVTQSYGGLARVPEMTVNLYDLRLTLEGNE